MEPDLTQSARESLARAIRCKANAFSLISDGAVLMTALYAGGAIDIRWKVVTALSVAIILDFVIRNRGLAALAAARGVEQLKRMHKRMPTYWLGAVVIHLTAFLAAVDIVHGRGTPLAYFILVVFGTAGVFVHFRLKPAMDQAWERLRELDSRASQ